MSIKRQVREMFWKLGYNIERIAENEPGIEPCEDIRRLVHIPNPVLFDVGANVGQTTTQMRNIFPACTVHCFEPSSEAYRKLVSNLGAMPGIILNNVAVGDENKDAVLYEATTTEMSSLLKPGQSYWDSVAAEIQVKVKTLDTYCLDANVNKIDILKIDTQGYDLRVIKGASDLLDRNAIKLILTEIIFNDIYKDSSTFEETLQFLRDKRFRLIALYKTHYLNGIACWADALFGQIESL